MISQIIASIRVHQRAQGAAIDHQPSDERPKLVWIEYIDLFTLALAILVVVEY